MAKKSGRVKPPDEIREEIALSREQVARNLRGVRYEMDLPRRIRRSIRQQPLPWIATAAAAGIFLVLMVTRRQKIYVDANKSAQPQSKLMAMGFALGAMRLASSLLKPMIVNFVERKVNHYTSGPAKRW
ncbi:MAG: hypothetical protein ABI925_06875 [Verrucomicrobiota bacterium]